MQTNASPAVETIIWRQRLGSGEGSTSVEFIQSLSHIWLFVSPWTAAPQASLSITNSQSLLKLISIESVMPSNHLILCCPLLLLPSIFPSIRVLYKESGLRMRWPKYWCFSFSISPFNEYSGLISFSMDWLDFLAVQGTLKSLLQHHSSRAPILQPILRPFALDDAISIGFLPTNTTCILCLPAHLF